jgi:hypothetical protein
MNGNTHTIKRAITGFALAAAVAAFVVSSALASGGPFYRLHTGATDPLGPHTSYGPHTKAGTSQTDGAATLMERHFKHEDSLYRNAAGTSSQCPCNVGHPAAADSTGTAVASSQTGPSSQCPCNTGLVGGPRVSIPKAGSSTPLINARGGLNWGSIAAIGGGVSLALIALAVGTLTARARNDSIKERRRLARALERAAVPERPLVGRGPRYLVQPSVTAACAPSLRTIAATLRDETQAIDDASLKAVQRFLTDGSGPFYGRDSTAALREAVRVQHMVIGTETADFGEERLAIAV